MSRKADALKQEWDIRVYNFLQVLSNGIDLNTLIAVSIAPVGTGEELSREVAEVVKVIRESGLPNKTYSMFTELEGDWDEVMEVVKRATFVLAEKGIRTEVVLKADIRPGFTGTMSGKLDRLNAALNKSEVTA